MIRYALECATCAHEFEAWFPSSQGFDQQAEAGLLQCPVCASGDVGKQIMAPAVRAKSHRVPEQNSQEMLAHVAKAARQHIAENCDYVGDDFANEARAMHYGEIEERAIWGETTSVERAELAKEGVPASPLPAPFAPTPPGPKKALN